MRSTLRTLIATTVALGAIGAGLVSATSAGAFARGDVFLSLAGSIREYTPSGTAVAVFAEGHAGKAICFTPDGKYLVEPGRALFDNNGALVTSNWGSIEGGQCAADSYDDIYVTGGPAGGEFFNAWATLRKYDVAGDLLATYTVPIRYRYSASTETVDVGPNQCTIYYAASGGSAVGTFDACHEHSTTEGFGVPYNIDGVKVRPNRQVIVGEDGGALLFSPAGEELRGFYPGMTENPNSYFRSVALDPDGTSFWVAADGPVNVEGHCKYAWRSNLETGARLGELELPCGEGVDGMAVYGTPGLKPTIKKLSPKKGAAGGGQTVTITGTGFENVTAVKFGAANPAASFTVNSSTSITAVTPGNAAGTDSVIVTAGGSSSEATSKARFKFGPPTVEKLSPSSGPSAGGTSVTITGTGFVTGTTGTLIKFGSAAATAVNCSSTTVCTLLTPPGKVAPVDVRATAGGQTSKKATGDRFTYN